MARMPNLLEDDALRSHLGPGGRWAVECGRRVKARRHELSFTLQQVADMAGSTLQTVSRVEAGKLVPRDHLKVALACALFVEPGELFALPDRATVHDAAAVIVP